MIPRDPPNIDGFQTEEAAAYVLALYDRWEWVLPAWCHRIILRFDPASGEPPAVPMSIDLVEPWYHFARINVYPAFFSLDRDQDLIMLHEFGHVFLAPLATRAHGFLGGGDENEAQRTILEQQEDDVVEELARVWLWAGPRCG